MAEIQPIPVVVGTAGHIDHGKSALVEALCGEHPDRWQEEKDRGITLDLGYAQMELGDGLEVGFVDVPGHERLVRKMVAGATGMGAALLVVACDDGVMPQTREHFEVLQVMGVDRGLVVLNKADLVDEETIVLVQGEVEELVAGTPWEGCAILAASAKTAVGLDEVRAAIHELVRKASREVGARRVFRLPVQRSFALHGAGTVATGVCASGELLEEVKVQALPGGGSSRVRRIQVHGRQAGRALPGLRTALNLPDLRPEECPRGTVLCPPGGLESGSLLRASVTFLPGAPSHKSGAPIHVLSGTAAIPGLLFLPPEGVAGEDILADLELASPIVLATGDRLLVRRPSPGCNLARGRFLGFASRRLRTRDEKERKNLKELAANLDVPRLRVAALLGWLESPVRARELAAKLGLLEEAVLDDLQAALADGLVQDLGDGRWLGAAGADAVGDSIRSAVANFRESNPHRLAIPLEALRTRLGKETFGVVSGMKPEGLHDLGLEPRTGKTWGLVGAEVLGELAADTDRLLEALVDGGLAPQGLGGLAASCGLGEDAIGTLLENLADRRLVLTPGKGLWFATSAVEELRAAVVEQLEGEGVDIPALRDRFSTSRKFMMPLLEFLDEKGVTARRGANRVLAKADAPLA